MGQDSLCRDVPSQVIVEVDLLGGDGDVLAGPATAGGGYGATLGVGLGNREENGGVEPEVAEKFRREPEVLAGIGGEAF